jgi:hypothetical protein
MEGWKDGGDGATVERTSNCYLLGADFSLYKISSLTNFHFFQRNKFCVVVVDAEMHFSPGMVMHYFQSSPLRS